MRFFGDVLYDRPAKMSESNQITTATSARILNIPNALTFIRILAVPGVIAISYARNDRWDDFWVALLFGTALLTDIADGFIARRTHQITRLGKVMDPIADKLMVMTAILLLIRIDRLDVIVAVILLGREMIISGLRALASSEGIEIPPNLIGKLKVFAEGFALAFLLLGREFSLGPIRWFDLGTPLIYLALALALTSAFTYFRSYYRQSLKK